MYKIIFTFLSVILLTVSAQAQRMGIGTRNPHPSAMLEVKSSNMGALLPRLTTAERNAIASPAIGLIVFNTDDDCLNIYTAAASWINMCTGSTPPTGGTITALNCAAASHTGSIDLNSAPTAVISIPYSGGNDGVYPTTNFFTADNKFLARLVSTTLSASGGVLSLPVSASPLPTQNGVATFDIVIDGKSCSYSINVGTGPTATATITCGTENFVGSSLTQGVAVSSSYFTINYANGNSGYTYPAETLTNNGVTATRRAGTLSTTGAVTYDLSGTPTSTSVNFNVSMGAQNSCPVTFPVTPAFAITCQNNNIQGNTLEQGKDASGSYFFVTYTNGNGSSYPSESITSNGVTATRAAGNFINGNGSVRYNLSGVVGASSLSFTTSLGGQSCATTVSNIPASSLPPSDWLGYDDLHGKTFTVGGKSVTVTIDKVGNSTQRSPFMASVGPEVCGSPNPVQLGEPSNSGILTEAIVTFSSPVRGVVWHTTNIGASESPETYLILVELTGSAFRYNETAPKPQPGLCVTGETYAYSGNAANFYYCGLNGPGTLTNDNSGNPYWVTGIKIKRTSYTCAVASIGGPGWNQPSTNPGPNTIPRTAIIQFDISNLAIQ